MKLFIYLLLIIFPFGQLTRISLFGGEATIHLNDIVVFLSVSFWFLSNPKNRIKSIIEGKLGIPIALFGLIIAISLLANSTRLSLHQLVISSLYGLRWIFFAGLFFVFKDLSTAFKKEISRWLIIATLTVAIAGLLQYVLLPDVSFLKVLGWDDHYYRLISTFFDPGFTGAILALGLGLIFVSKIFLKEKLIFLIITFCALALTYSRASYLMYLTIFGIISYYQRNVKIIIVATLLLIATIFVLPQPTGEGVNLTRENSTVARFTNWQTSIEIWQRFPIIGVGFDSYRYVKPNTTTTTHSGAGADSSLLLILATTGIVGLICYGWLLYRMAHFGRRNVIFIASLGGVLIHSFFNNTLLYPWVMGWLWIILAVQEEE